MVVIDFQPQLTQWLCERIGYTPTATIRCLGATNSHGALVGVVGFDNFNGASVMMHVAGEGNWMRRDILRAAFDYPFRVMGVNMVLGLVPSGNVDALKLNEHLGFTRLLEIPDAHPDGSLILMVMRREDCRWIRTAGPTSKDH